MQLTNAFVPIVGVIATVVSATPTPKPPPCIVPQVLLTSLPKPFTVSVLTAGPSTTTQQASWPLHLSPPKPSKEKESVPVISNAKIAQPTFKLVNQTLLADGFTADLQPTITIFPPPLQGFDFGGPAAADTPGKFGAAYACDSQGNQILRLVPDGGSLTLSFLDPVPFIPGDLSLRAVVGRWYVQCRR